MIEITTKEGKNYTNISNLFNWDKNPKRVMSKDFERLKNQIKSLGVYAPLLVTPEGEVLGGNTRLKALKDLGEKEIWISIVNPKNEAEKIKYAISSNDMVGEYDEDQLAELVMGIDTEIDLEDYHVSMKDISLDKLLTQIGPDITEDDTSELDKGCIVCPKCGHVFDGKSSKAITVN